jgi:hypothetical protein
MIFDAQNPVPQSVTAALQRVNEVLFGALTPSGNAFRFHIGGVPALPPQVAIPKDPSATGDESQEFTLIKLNQILSNAYGQNGLNVVFQ